MTFTTIAELILYVAIFASTIYVLIFGYHWYSYGSSNRTSTIAMAVFIGGTAFFLLTMFLSMRLF